MDKVLFGIIGVGNMGTGHMRTQKAKASENNIVQVDTGKRIKRSGFEPKQVVYPKKD